MHGRGTESPVEVRYDLVRVEFRELHSLEVTRCATTGSPPQRIAQVPSRPVAFAQRSTSRQSQMRAVLSVAIGSGKSVCRFLSVWTVWLWARPRRSAIS